MAAGHRAPKRGSRAARPVARAVGVRADRAAAIGGMDLATALGTAMTLNNTRRATLSGWPRGRPERAPLRVLVVIGLVLAASNARAADRYALIISGAAGGDQYAEKYNTWRTAITTTLVDTFKYPPDRVVVLADAGEDAATKSTRENVQRAFADLRKRMTKDDQLLVLLIGHGTTADGDEAKFNLVGPDLTATEWAELVKPLPGRLVFVNTTAASFPFLRKIAGRNRIVLTATDSSAQQFETVFADYFVKAFGVDGADVDKSGRVSMWEAFSFAS